MKKFYSVLKSTVLCCIIMCMVILIGNTQNSKPLSNGLIKDIGSISVTNTASKTNLLKNASVSVNTVQTINLINSVSSNRAAMLNMAAKDAMFNIEVNGTIDPSIQQGLPFNYIITGLDNGGNVMNEMWIDIDSNGIINPAIDLLFVSFPQTDGQQSNQGPGDEDGIANGTITTAINGLYFPVGHYIFKTATSINTSFATFVITPLTVTTFSVSGTVTNGGVGVGNIVVQLWSQNAQIFEVTNAAGYYIINTNVSTGTAVELSIPNDGSFNITALAGLVVTPNKYAGPITASMTGADFVIASGKIIMGRVIDAQGNPIAGIEVNASIQNQNGNGYHATTDGNGMYMLSVQSGDYQVIFGSYNSPKGYLLTVYNQKYSNGNSNLVHVLSNTDTIKNIDATLFKGALITGAMKNNGSPVQGNITVFNYNNPSGPVYQSGYDGGAGLYYLYVLPGTYSIYFQQNNSGPSAGVYYNQTSARPGTAINVNNISDTIRNIDVDFGTVPPCISTSSVSNISICQNQLPFNWNGQNFNGNGTYNMHMTNAAGCDSSLTLNLTTKVSSSSYTSISISASALPYSWNGITFYTASMQTAHITNTVGCDSSATLNLTVQASSTSTSNMITCASALPFNWNGIVFTTAGSQTAHLINSVGNDSAATLNLTILASSSSITNMITCASALPFSWNGIIFTTSGTQVAHLTNSEGCDSAATLNLTLKLSSVSITNMVNCASSLPFNWNGVIFTTSGTQTAHLTNSVGCDSAATLNFTMNANSFSVTNMTTCATAVPFNWNGLIFTTSGTQTAHLTNSVGCDSAATLNYTMNAVSSSVTNMNTTATALPFNWNGVIFTTAGTQTAHLTNSKGCDSAATLNLTVNTGITGNGLSFDGVNDNVSIGNPAALQFDSTSSFTIEVWLNPNTANSSSWNAVIDKSYYGSQKGFLIYNGGGTLIVANVNGFASVGSTSLPYNVWTHIAVSYNNGTWKLYKNGILKSTTTNKFYKDASSPVTIGMRTANTGIGQTDAYAGLMDEVRFWNIEKTAAAIQIDMNCDVAQQAGLVAYYRFDQGTSSGTNTGINYANDYSGNGNCGTLNNFALSGDTSNWVMGTISSCNSINVNCAPNYVWTGATSTNWSVASNWSNNVLPTAGVTVNIPSAPTNQPVLSTDISVGGMILNGTVSFNGNTFTITGAVSGTGTIKGSATSSLVVNSSSSNTINFGTTATDSLLANLTISGAGTVTIGTGVGITNLLTVSSGSLNTNNHLTLKSTSIANTAVVGTVGGTITGNVTVERFIPKGVKAYRSLITGGVFNAGSIFNNWQEKGINSNGYGMFITGKAGSANGVDVATGFDISPAGNKSMYNYLSYMTYSTVNNTKTTNLDPYTGYLTVVYGNRAMPLIPANIFDASAMMNAAATIRTTGSLIAGTVTYSNAGVVNAGYSSSVTKILPLKDTGSFIANPYACAIDWESLSRTNLTTSYYYYEPTYFNGGYQSFVSYNATSHTNSNPTKSKINRYIQPGQGFWVQTNSTVTTNRQLVITELNKVTNQPFTAVFGSDGAAINRLAISLWKNGENIDGAVVAFSDNYTKAYGDEDSRKMFGNAENMYISEGSNALCIDGLAIPMLNDGIALQTNGMMVGKDYSIQLDAQELNTNGLAVYLVDAVLQTSVLLNQGTSVYKFTVNNINESRFTIVFKQGSALPVNFIDVKAYQGPDKISNIINWTIADEINIDHYEVEQSALGNDYSVIATVLANNKNAYTTIDKLVNNTINYYRIKAVDIVGKIGYSKVVVLITKETGSIAVMPNPVTSGIINVQLNNLVGGKYKISLYNNAGQLVASMIETLKEGNSSVKFPIKNKLETGTYTLHVSGINNYVTTLMINRK